MHVIVFSDYSCRQRRLARQRGALLICVLICLGVVIMLLGALMKTTLLTQRQLRTERNLRQTEWLVEAGIERAAFRLSRDDSYQGETWQLDAAKMGTNHAAKVTIQRSPTDEEAIAKIRVVANYPAGTASAVQRSRTVRLRTTN